MGRPNFPQGLEFFLCVVKLINTVNRPVGSLHCVTYPLPTSMTQPTELPVCSWKLRSILPKLTDGAAQASANILLSCQSLRRANAFLKRQHVSSNVAVVVMRISLLKACSQLITTGVPGTRRWPIGLGQWSQRLAQSFILLCQIHKKSHPF